MPVAAIIASVAGSVISGGLGYLGAKSAAKAQERAADKASATQREFYYRTRADLAPYRNTGAGALRSLANLYGLSGKGPFDPAAVSQFNKSPDYQYALQEGLSAVNKSRAAKGLLQSGGTLEELQSRGAGIASQNFGNYVSRLLQLAGLGQNAAAQTGSAGIATGQGIANSQMAAGEAQASGIVGGTNAITGAIGDISQNLTLYRLMNGGRSAYGGLSPDAYGASFNPGLN